MPDSARLSYWACALSIAAIAMGAVALKGAAPSGPKDASGEAASIVELQQETARLRRDVDALNASTTPGAQQLLPLIAQRLTVVEALVGHHAVDAGRGQSAAHAAAQSQDPLDRFRPEYAAIKTASGSITIRQNPENRMFVVSNSDPALTNTPIAVEAIRVDGTVERYLVMVPAPSASPAER